MLVLGSHTNTAFPISCRESKAFSSLFLSLVASLACDTNHTEESGYLSSWCPDSFKIFFFSSLLPRPWCEINFCSPKMDFFTLPYPTAMGKSASHFLSCFLKVVFGYFNFSFLKDEILTHKRANIESQVSQMPLTVLLTVLSGVTRKWKKIWPLLKNFWASSI